MNVFRILFDWENPEGAKGAELRATWARISMEIDGNPITEIYNRRVRSVGGSLYMPLYPFAEWIVEMWWNLFYEPHTPGRRAGETYRRRHSLLYAEEGYVMPDLTITPMGETVALAWKPYSHPQSPIRFISEGSGVCLNTQVRQEFADLIEAVINRLQEEGTSETYLETEWNAIKATSPEEHEFCIAAAALGLDPYNSEDAQTEAILDVSRQLPQEATWEFFGAAEADFLVASALELRKAQSIASHSPVEIPFWELREPIRRSIDPRWLPWEKGYGVADLLRRGLGDDLGVTDIVSQSGRTDATGARWLDGLVRVEDERQFVFASPRTHLRQARFAAARGLFEYLTAPEEEWRLLTRGQSDQQASNRAFAAEILVPSESLRSSLTSDYIGQEEIDELADRYTVSPWVVRHQIENHRLATFARD